ncbi:MAG TPA: hypothetical protein VHK88_08475 [Aquihabitans sp.]|nr:hypothetical protein [Aquihabitans sp.]
MGGTLAATGLDLAAPLLLALVLLVCGALLLRWSVLSARRDGTAG